MARIRMRKVVVPPAMWQVLFLALLPGAALALEPPHDASNDITCDNCHAMHSSGMGGTIVPRGEEQEALCKSCHNPSGQAYNMSDVANHVVRGGTIVIDCGSCHDPHGPQTSVDEHTGIEAVNLKLIRDNTTLFVPQAVEPAVFQVRPDHFSFETAPYNGICQTCHTDTLHHSNTGVDPHHMVDAVCTTCHLHERGFLPGGCTDCHSESQNGRRIIVGAQGDFERRSHHVRTEVTDDDCLACHYVRDHGSGIPKVFDPDQGFDLVYEYDPGSPAELAGFCLACHDADGSQAGAGAQPFSDQVSPPDVEGGGVWAASAHGSIGYDLNGGAPVSCFGDGQTSGCHGNAHGSENEKILMAPAGDSIDVFCYNCHTDGKITNDALSNNRPGGYHSADDIEEAFSKSEKHDLGTGFSVDGFSYTLQCTSCHNPHVVTGKYWDASFHVTPVTRPEFGDPEYNPRAMGSTLWGDEPGEKMDDFAARVSGSGGWYFSEARGHSIALDQAAKYQPPKAGSGYEFEFGGDILPDYTTLCLDCHTYRMSSANPPINWGQGVSCTGNSVDPPDQRVACGAQHGLGLAGTPYYVSDEGKSGFWGASGNPDMIFQMNYVTRGRHNGHFMRWPYDSAERSAGANFVMSCTDCHEAHGSNRGSIIRERFNVNSNGDCGTGGDSSPNGENCSDGGNWNSFCNACHYYYGGQHSGMSCGNASCHEANSIHRIIHNTDSGGGTQLMLTAAGYESYYESPDFTPDILEIDGDIGSAELLVTFATGVWAGSDLTGPLTPEDFWLFDKDGNNPRQIVDVLHLPGEASAILTMSAPMQDADIFRDTLATTGKSVWAWYDGGYENWATGTIGAQAVSAGPWPVAISTSLYISDVQGAEGFEFVRVDFSMGVFAQPDATGALTPAHFQLVDVDGNNPRSILNVEHTAGDSTAILVMSAPLVAADLDKDTVAPVSADAIFDESGASLTSAATAIRGTYCPDWGTRFELNEPEASATAMDETGLLVGVVGNPVLSFPGDGYFHGFENEDTFIDFNNNSTCLKAPRSLTLEAVVKTTEVDLDFEDTDGDGIDDNIDRNSTQQRVFERKRTIQFTIMRGDWWGDNVPARAGRARVMVKYRVTSENRRDCGDEGQGKWMKQVASDIDLYPIVSYHYYRIRVVFNANKSNIPIDIWADDLGTDGLGTDELWQGFINIAMPDPADSAGCLYGAEPGDIMESEDQFHHIGAPPNHNAEVLYKGLIDWVSWRPLADYSGVDDAPHY